jgi:hypothetical protein
MTLNLAGVSYPTSSMGIFTRSPHLVDTIRNQLI